MGEENQDSNPVPDPKEDHEVPSLSQDQSEEAQSTEGVDVEVETPGGTTVTESPSEDDSNNDGIKDSL